MNNVGPIVTGKDGRSTAKSKKLAERLVKTSSSAGQQHVLVMVALCNRADRYIFALLFLSFLLLFSSPNLSGRMLDVYHTLTHGVALVRI